MNSDQVKGAVNDAAGRAKRQAGEWTGDVNTQVEGAAQQLKGKAQKAVGNIKQSAHEAQVEADREASADHDSEFERGREYERERQARHNGHA